MKRFLIGSLTFLLFCAVFGAQAAKFNIQYGAKNYDLTFWGDSLTAGAGANASGQTGTYPYKVANTAPLGRWYYNGGVGAQTSTQIAVRQGGVATTATVVGGQIPTSGGVTVTFATGFEPVTSQGPPGGTNGTISGVYGTVTLSGGTYTFTRLFSGSLVNITSAPFIVDPAGPNNGTELLWVGRNNASNMSQVLSDTAGMVANIPSNRYLILSVINGEGEGIGTSVYNQIAALNAAFLSVYGTHYIDVRASLVAAYNPANPLDVIDHANDIPPFSLRSVNLNGTLTQSIDVSATSFTLSIAAGANWILQIGTEYIYVNAVSGTTVTNATRGYGSSIAAPHNNGDAFAGTDPLHLSAAGYTVVAAQAYAPIAANGW